MKMAMIAVHQKLHPRMVLAVHDELLFELPNDGNLRESISMIISLMEGVYKLAVPLKVEVKVGRSWGSLHDFDS